VVLRPRAVYGAGDPHLVPRLLSRVRRGLLVLPGPSVRLSLTAVENLTEACLSAAGWPPGAYNIADPAPYDRDEAIRAVLRAHGVRARIGHLPLPVARAAAGAAQTLARLRPYPQPSLTRYAVDQLAYSVVLDVSKAQSQGWVADRTLKDYETAHLSR
jgi:nucleoside-diphosphate-sugar epimerase